ncbi:MAG: hypothetical protein E7062_09115 [Spirochaetaceae bacterium]|nr:hypothetical protein [Spirochaetaceae bacterium]
MNKEYRFSAQELETQLDFLSEKKITQIFVSDTHITTNKKRLLDLLKKIEKKAPSVFFDFTIDYGILDGEILQALTSVFASIRIPLTLSYDKKLLQKKINLCNDYEIVYGFMLDFSSSENLTFKTFRDSLDFIISLYPNHLYFNNEDFQPTRILSSFDKDKIVKIQHACEAFYTYGRAVPWFLSVLKALKINSTAFFTDFAEWQLCNNCSIKTGVDFSVLPHEEIEKMQLAFLELKCDEKKVLPLFHVIADVVKLNGAFSRIISDEKESILDLHYHPEDLFSQDVLDLHFFADNVCMEENTYKVLLSDEGPAFELV